MFKIDSFGIRMDAAIALPVLLLAGIGWIFSAFELSWDAFAGIFGVVSGIFAANVFVHRASPKLIKGSLLTTLGIGGDWFSIFSEPGKAKSILAKMTALVQDGSRQLTEMLNLDGVNVELQESHVNIGIWSFLVTCCVMFILKEKDEIEFE